jgi:hypothetical protein
MRIRNRVLFENQMALAIQVLILGIQNKELKAAKSSSSERIREGDYFQFGDLQNINNDIHPDTVGQHQLIFVITTTRPFCKQSMPIFSFPFSCHLIKSSSRIATGFTLFQKQF